MTVRVAGSGTGTWPVNERSMPRLSLDSSRLSSVLCPGLDDRGRLEKLLSDVGDADDRRAAFVCWAALAHPDGRTTTRKGVCRGSLLRAPSGSGGFGYDPVFQPEGHSVSMAELPAGQKNRISHRGRALAALAPEIEALAR